MGWKRAFNIPSTPVAAAGDQMDQVGFPGAHTVCTPVSRSLPAPAAALPCAARRTLPATPSSRQLPHSGSRCRTSAWGSGVDSTAWAVQFSGWGDG